MSPVVLWDEIAEDWVPLSAFSAPTHTPVPVGAFPLGTVSYPLPASNFAVVSPSGSDGNSGSLASPKATLSGAMAALSSGGTVVFRGGTYPESNVFTSKSITIQPYLTEIVYFDGTDVETSWTSSGGLWWAPLTVEFSHGWGHSDPPGDALSRWVDAQNPIAHYSDLLFIDGVRQWQVDTTPTVGQFQTDYTANRVWIAENPSGKEVRVTKRSKFLHVQHANCTIQGVCIRRYATEMAQFGALYIASGGTGCHVSNVHFDDIATQAVHVVGTDCIFEDFTIRRPGQTGLDTNRADRIILRRFVIRNHNYEKFKTQPHAGGVKVTFTGDTLIEHFYIDGGTNRGTNIWFDASNWGGVIVNGYTSGGFGGVFIEASGSFLVGGVEMRGLSNTYHGFLATIAKEIEVWNCSSHRTNGYHFANWQDNRWGPYERFAAEGGNWEAIHNRFYNLYLSGDHSLFMWYNRRDASAATYAYEEMVLDFDGSVFAATAGQNPPLTASRLAGHVDGATQIDNTSVNTFQAGRPYATGNAMTSIQDATREQMANFSNAVPISTEAATAMGIPPGVRVVGPPRPRPEPREAA